mmetsp:Transcript_32429/g.47990  ORF Transcript_32429/g.47990 Transcript_32429/m.47990 type:complete len:93 (-) Transcript_32429:1130-1408(-)
MDGVIWNGIGLMVSIGPDHGTMTINGVEYNTTTTPLKLWTCSSIVITNTSLYIGREEIQRDLSLETTPPTTTSKLINFGMEKHISDPPSRPQ